MKKPERIRITGPAGAPSVTVGRVYEVSRWWEDGSPIFTDDGGYTRSGARPDGTDASPGLPAWDPDPDPDLVRLRDTFAAAALTGLISRPGEFWEAGCRVFPTPENLSRGAYAFADAMLDAREQNTDKGAAS